MPAAEPIKCLSTHGEVGERGCHLGRAGGAGADRLMLLAVAHASPALFLHWSKF